MKYVTTSLVSLGVVVGAAMSGCGGDGGDSPPTGTATAIEAPAPPERLVGTGSPGDIFEFDSGGGGAGLGQLRSDRGTPGDTSDDFLAVGEVVGALGAYPAYFTVDVSSTDESIAEVGGTYWVVRLPGFGYALGLRQGAVTLVDPGACSVSAFPDMTAFQAGFGSRIESFWAALNGITAAEGGIDVNGITPGGPNGPVNLRGAACSSAGRMTFTSVSTPQTRAVDAGTAGYPFEGPTPADTLGIFSERGAFLLDYGLDYGSLVAVPTADLLDDDVAARQALSERLEGRTLVGLLTQVAVFQPAGADREDPAVTRTQQGTTYYATITLADSQHGTMRLETAPGQPPVASDIDVTVTLTSAGRLTVSAELTTGISPLVFDGIVVDNDEGTSFVLSAPFAGDATPIAALAPTVPVGQELRRLSYAFHLRLAPPRGCLGDGVTLPSDYTDSLGQTVGSVLGLSVDRIAVSLAPSGRSAVATLEDDSTVDFSAMPNFMLMRTGTPVQLSTAPGRVVRLLCGPEYPWAPVGGDIYAEAMGVDTGAAGNVGFSTPGTYVIESGMPGGLGDASSQYFVFEVSEAP